MARIRRLKTMFGQSAVELAVFGAVVIFVVGLVLRTGLSDIIASWLRKRKNLSQTKN